MRFIGSKNLLLEEIKIIIQKNIKKDVKVFCDIFSGTASVARFFKNDYKILSNDLLFFSYVIQKAIIGNNKRPKFIKLKKNGVEPFKYLNEVVIDLSQFKEAPFIFENYSPNKKSERCYLSNENALKIDFIRQQIEEWKQKNLINENEYYYLLAALIEATPFVSNIAGTYGAYLKHWDNRALKKIILLEPKLFDNKLSNKCYNEDANLLIKKIKGDILYIDPPYNERQYLPNYHLLETVAKYDKPDIYGKTGMRPYKTEKSNYCIKAKVLSEFSDLIKNANFKYIIVSYSSEGIMSKEEIKKILIQKGIEKTFILHKISYRRYKHKKGISKHNLEEYLFFIVSK